MNGISEWHTKKVQFKLNFNITPEDNHVKVKSGVLDIPHMEEASVECTICETDK